MSDTSLDNPRRVSRAEADALKKTCCSACWRPITASFKWNRETQANEDTVTCGTPDCPMPGFVSPRFVETRTQVSYGEFLDAKHALHAVLPRRVTTETEILAELGLL